MLLGTSQPGKFYHTTLQKGMESHQNVLVYCEKFCLTKQQVRIECCRPSCPGPILYMSISFCAGSPKPCTSHFLAQPPTSHLVFFVFHLLPRILTGLQFQPLLTRHSILPSSPGFQELLSGQLPACSQLLTVASCHSVLIPRAPYTPGWSFPSNYPSLFSLMESIEIHHPVKDLSCLDWVLW